MQRRFSKVAIAGAAFVVIAGLTMVIRGDVALRQRTGVPLDWSHSHLIFSNPGSFAQAVRSGSVAHWYKIMNDPRYQIQQIRRNAPALPRDFAMLKPAAPKPAPAKSQPLTKDWNFSLQTAALGTGVLYLRYPAKYSFSETGANCSSDYVIYVLNVPGSASQANLVGVNNLYVGAAGGGGCGSITNNGGAGTNPTPQVMWAFNVATSHISTSPVLSLDGTKVAYVLNSTPPVLHVLTLPSTQSGTITSPTSSFAACGGTAPALCTVTLSSTPSGNADNISAPYVDYGSDTGYVGDNNGHLYKIHPFFGGTPAITATWTAGSSILGPPVYDGNTGTVFVGSFDGNLYGINASTGAQITGSPLALAGSGTPSYGIWASPIVDSTNHVLYAFYGDNHAGTNAEVAQVVYYNSSNTTVEFVGGSAGTPGSASSTAGTNKADFLTTSPNTYLIAEGAFSTGYYTGGPTGASSFLYACGTNALNTGSNAVGVTLQQFGFSSGVLQTPKNVDTINSTLTASGIGANGEEQPCSPLTEFYNTNTSTDRLFLSVPGLSSGNILGYNITTETSGGALTPAATGTAVDGTSGIVVDGSDPTSNASSLYFTSQDSGTCTTGGASGTSSELNNGIGTVSPAICAYKLTQSGLL